MFHNNRICVFVCACFSVYVFVCACFTVTESVCVCVCRCMEVPTRVAAYDLLVTLCSGSYENFSSVATQLISMHHKSDPQIAKEWEVGMAGIGSGGRDGMERWEKCMGQGEGWVEQRWVGFSSVEVKSCRLQIFLSLVSASSHWKKWVWLCWSEECRGHMLHEFCPPAALHE